MNWWDYPFFLETLIVLLPLTILLGLFSPLVVSGRRAYLGEAMGHSSFLGLALASVFLINSHPLLQFLFAISITCLTSMILAKSIEKKDLTSDSLIGVYLVVTVSIGFLFHHFFSKNSVDLMAILFGDLLLIGKNDLIFSLAIFLFCGLQFYKYQTNWNLMIFDQNLARIRGINVQKMNTLLILNLTLIVVTAVKLAGSLVVNSLLLLPGLFAISKAGNLAQATRLALFFSVSTATLGLLISMPLDAPLGPTLALVQFGCFLGAKSFRLKKNEA